MKRLLTAAVLAAAVLSTPVAAQAAGVGGVEVTPPDGSSFRVSVTDGGSVEQEFALRNITDQPAQVRLYAAAAEQVGDDGWSVGGAGSAGWLELPDQQVSLAAGEARTLRFSVRGGPSDRTGAVVVEVGEGTVVQRAATLVHVDAGSRLPLPLIVVVVAVCLLLAAGAAVATVARRRQSAS